MFIENYLSYIFNMVFKISQLLIAYMEISSILLLGDFYCVDLKLGKIINIWLS